MISKLDRLLYLREAMFVRRYHTMSHVCMPETVGQHTVNVVNIVLFLYDDNPPTKVIGRTLHHDAAEFITGDIPATAKWRSPTLSKALAEEEKQIDAEYGLYSGALEPKDEALLKYADMMDLCLKSVEEMTTGNQLFGPVLARGMAFCRNLLDTTLKGHEKANELFQVLFTNPYIGIAEVIDESAPKTH